MVWTAASTKILSLTPASLVQSNKETALTQFQAVGIAFPLDGTATFLFVHAHDITNNFQDYHVIPCQDVTVKTQAGTSGQQDITFAASIHERKSGSYHLIGWAPAEQGAGGFMVNHATILLNAFTLEAAPEDQMKEALAGTPHESEPD